MQAVMVGGMDAWMDDGRTGKLLLGGFQVHGARAGSAENAAEAQR